MNGWHAKSLALALILPTLLTGCGYRIVSVDELEARRPIVIPPPPKTESNAQTVKIIVREPEKYELWPDLFLSPSDLEAEERAMQLEDLAISARELDHADSNDPLTVEAQLLLLNYLKTSGLLNDESFEAESRAVLRDLVAELILEQVVESTVEVTDEEARAVYQERLEEYQTPERVSIRLILVPTEDEAEAVYARIEAGEDFG